MDAGAIVIGAAAFLSMFILVCVCRRQSPPPPVPEPVIVQVREDPGDPEASPPR